MVIKAYRKPYNAEQPEQVGEGFELLDNRSLATVSGWWLAKRRAALGVIDDVLERLKARLYDRSTTRWAQNPATPCSSNRGACCSRRRPSTPPLKASDGRVARNPSGPRSRARASKLPIRFWPKTAALAPLWSTRVHRPLL